MRDTDPRVRSAADRFGLCMVALLAVALIAVAAATGSGDVTPAQPPELDVAEVREDPAR